MSVLPFLKSYWKTLAALLIPIVLLPLVLEPLFGDKIYAARCGYVMIIMGSYWVLELVAIPITGLLPAILFPLLGVQKAEDVCINYFKDSVMLFVGGLLVAMAVEETNLHRRIALRVLLIVGARPYWIMAGFMIVSAGLSMFISNTATTAMILPIAVAVTVELNRHAVTLQQSRSTIEMTPIQHQSSNSVYIEGSEEESKTRPLDQSFPDSSAANIADVIEKAEAQFEDAEINFKSLSPRQQEISKALVLSVAYAASIGGMATLTGTLTNVIFYGQFREQYNNAAAREELTYASFSFFALPTMIICLIVAWCWLTFQFFLFPYLQSRVSEHDPEIDRNMKQMFRRKFSELGPVRFAEMSALALFLTLVVLWFFRAPGFMAGWDTGFRQHFITDATPAVLIGFLLFLWPRQIPVRGTDGKWPKYQAILTWKVIARKFPWDVVLLLGGSLALADGVEKSGLTDVLKGVLLTLSSIPPLGICAILALIVTFCTEFASNSAIATIFIPLVIQLAEGTCVNPLYYMLPVTISCSFAFMFPVATPPNAIVFSSGFLRVIDMVKAGVVLNFVCMGIMIGSLHTFGYWVFHLDQYPEWAPQENCTALQFHN
ncbi:Solute carrier family 13 member 2 [Hypsibius exemplaris]|uniref:Solute carrier family 13 member 2 n=1 Tax=Hypsibius exemplaris TaxID=2072580 RepID=A0A1W0WVG5_HYPEX|nr:Solute carrier family 13 member 2 [Hypsibius exemplaris]